MYQWPRMQKKEFIKKWSGWSPHKTSLCTERSLPQHSLIEAVSFGLKSLIKDQTWKCSQKATIFRANMPNNKRGLSRKDEWRLWKRTLSGCFFHYDSATEAWPHFISCKRQPQTTEMLVKYFMVCSLEVSLIITVTSFQPLIQMTRCLWVFENSVVKCSLLYNLSSLPENTYVHI